MCREVGHPDMVLLAAAQARVEGAVGVAIRKILRADDHPIDRTITADGTRKMQQSWRDYLAAVGLTEDEFWPLFNGWTTLDSRSSAPGRPKPFVERVRRFGRPGGLAKQLRRGARPGPSVLLVEGDGRRARPDRRRLEPAEVHPIQRRQPRERDVGLALARSSSPRQSPRHPRRPGSPVPCGSSVRTPAS
jgi:hypothetical protein